MSIIIKKISQAAGLIASVVDGFGSTSETNASSIKNATNLNTRASALEAKVYVVSSGTSGIWKWKKWSDGTAECYGQTSNASAAVTTGWGNIFVRDGGILSVAYPFTFTSISCFQATPISVGNNYWIFTNSTMSMSASPAMGVARGTSATVTVSAYLYVKGTWS